MAGTADEEPLGSAIEDEETAAWVTTRAEELDLEPTEFLERMVQAYRAAEGDSATAVPTAAELNEAIETLQAEFTELLEDVRERVIQVKQETDTKAPQDHDHEELTARAETLESDVEELDDQVSALDERLAGGFENFEEIIEYLLDRTDDIQTDLQTLGSAVISLRERTEQLAAREQARARADRLKKIGAQHGVGSANCESCGSKIDLSMLSEATCPTCEAVFNDLEANPGFFGRSVLETGSRPALEGPSDVPDTDDLESVASGESGAGETRPDWGPETESGGTDSTETGDR